RTFWYIQVCIVGQKHWSSTGDQSKRLSSVQETIERERQAASVKDGFAPRDSYIPVKNCTQLASSVKKMVSNFVFRTLLNRTPEVRWLNSYNLVISDSLTVQTIDGRWWNPGGQLTVQETSELLDPGQLKLMKSQHGGLQTLLRNHHQAFEVRSGIIRLRWDPERMARLDSSRPSPVLQKPVKKCLPLQRKTKPCWMFSHHPDGCPYPSETCSFLHVLKTDSELDAEQPPGMH
ncbi:putative tRNA (Uracil-O(2)-)-methyltransferase, partial [Fasciolopsis buskii]